MNTGTLKQTMPVIEGEDYTLSLRLKKGTGSVLVKIINADEEYILFQNAEEIPTEWLIKKETFVSKGTSVRLEISNQNSNLIITDIMLVRGKYSKPWTSHTDEIYSDKVIVDGNGIKVENDGNGNKFIADTSNFGVYKGNEVMFGVDASRTISRNLHIPQSPNSKLVLGYVDVIIRSNGIDFLFNN